MIGLASRRYWQHVAVLLGGLALVVIGDASTGHEVVRLAAVAGEPGVPSLTTGQERLVPEPPGGPVPVAAYAVLERHCARCHQAGRLQDPPAAETFTNILAMGEVSRNPGLVRPGVPDASPLYTVMVRRAMPPETVPGKEITGAGPSPDEVEAVRDWIDGLPQANPAVVQTGGEAAAPTNHSVAELGHSLDLFIRSDKDTYTSGDLITFFVRATAECHLTLIIVDTRGIATVLFPNEMEQNNLLPVGQELRVPGQRAPYQFRARDNGRETLVGICTVGAKIADGIRQDYERQRFTTLGNWRLFLKRVLAGESPGSCGGGRRKMRRKAEAQPEGRLRPEHHVRTAITYEVQ
jgi:hypothetical protein